MTIIISCQSTNNDYLLGLDAVIELINNSYIDVILVRRLGISANTRKSFDYSRIVIVFFSLSPIVLYLV